MEFDPLARIAGLAESIPNAVAVDSGDRRINYLALDRHASAVAQVLRGAPNIAGRPVVVWTKDRAALVSVMLGVLRARAVFVPLATDTPDARMQHLLGRLRPTFLIHDARAESEVAARRHAGASGHGCVCIAVPAYDDAAPAIPTTAERGSPGAPAYIYFTSGSTGRPKGVVGSLAALAARITWEIETFGVKPGTRFSQLVTPTFDPWFRDVFVPLCSGGTICIPPDQPSRLEPERLLEWLRDADIEFMHCGPTLLNTLVSTAARIRRLPALRTVLSSGETLHVSLVRRWRRRFGRNVELVNLYGPTEATMAQFFHRVETDDEKRTFIPVGRSLPGVEVRIVNEVGVPCAAGVAGEILIGGAALSLGYWDDEAETAKSFVASGENASAVLYRTGDRGVEFQPGCYRLLGRIDDQAKIRGVRVEPREVEDALVGYPLIASCAVVARPDRDGESALIAYVVPETQYPPSVPEIRAYLRERFPPEYLPTVFVILKALPLSANGKIDRSRLPDPGDVFPPPANVAAPPRSALESALASAWAAILGLSAVGMRDNFLDLGGHSLSAIRLVHALREAGVGELSLREVFDHPTVAAQARLLEARIRAEQAQPEMNEVVPSDDAVDSNAATLASLPDAGSA